jgi:hypothetical protein
MMMTKVIWNVLARNYDRKAEQNDFGEQAKTKSCGSACDECEAVGSVRRI